MLRQLAYLFLPYRSLFFPFLVLAAIVVPCWLVFRLYRRRTLTHRVSLGREIFFLIFVVYLAGLVAATLTPNRSDRLVATGRGGIELRPDRASLTCSSPSLPKGSTAEAFCIHNARGNIMLFFPLGVLIALGWRRLSFWRGTLIAIAVSFSIEVLQYLSSAWGSYRAADVNDVILNVFGACLGLALVFVLRFFAGTRHALSHK